MKHCEGSGKKYLIIGQVSSILYWVADNLYLLSKLHTVPVTERQALIFYCIVGLACYLETMAFHVYTLWKAHYFPQKGQNNKRLAILGIIKETIDNITLLPYLGVGKESWLLKVSGSIGSCISGALSLYLPPLDYC